MIALAADFPAPTRDDWMSKVGSVLLKGRPDAGPEAVAEAFARRLVHRTEDGIEVQPLYTSSDADPGLLQDFIIEARWPTGRLLREYTILVDPPLFDTSTPVAGSSMRKW